MKMVFLQHYLTLTSVVFEFITLSFAYRLATHLTLTSVVFEFACLIGTAIAKANLTLTSVVFEYDFIHSNFFK